MLLSSSIIYIIFYLAILLGLPISMIHGRPKSTTIILQPQKRLAFPRSTTTNFVEMNSYD